MARKQIAINTSNTENIINLKNFLLLAVLVIVTVTAFFAFTGINTQEKLEDLIQDPQGALAASSQKQNLQNDNSSSGPYANKITSNEVGGKITIPKESIGGGANSDAVLEVTPEGPKYTYDVQSDAELQVILAALFFQGKYAFPDAEEIIVEVNFPDKPSKTFRIPASTVDETREEHTNFTEFYKNVTTT